MTVFFLDISQSYLSLNMATMELRACTRSCTRAINAQKMATTAITLPITSSFVYSSKKAVVDSTALSAACNRIVLTRRQLIAPLTQEQPEQQQPQQQPLVAEPPIKRTRRKRQQTKAQRISLADLNNAEQQLRSSPSTNKENNDEVVPVVSGTSHLTPSKAQQQLTPNRQLLITSFVKFRRSSRQTTATLKKQREKEIEMKLMDNHEDGLKKQWFGEKGFGVVAGRRFEKDEFVCEYAGELLPSLDAACERECCYACKPDVGCYMYYFKHLDSAFCVDATRDNGRFGRLINHSRRNANVKTQVMDIDAVPRLYFVTLRQIEVGEELVYDYGERRPEVLEKLPWLKD